MMPDPTGPEGRAVDVAVVFTCYGSADLTIDCLRSLAPERGRGLEIQALVCENGTGQWSVDLLEGTIAAEGWQDWVSLFPVTVNRGFTGGNNVVLEAIRRSGHPPRFVLLLNTDTIVRPGAIAGLVGAAERHPEAGIVGPRLEWPDGEPQVSCFRFLSPGSEVIKAAATGPVTRVLRRFDVPIAVTDEPCRPEWLSFACALLRWDVIEDVGLLDEGFYLYFDDVDYCRRARSRSWEVLHWPAARVVHLRGRSNPLKELTSARKRAPRYQYASRTRYFRKFYGPLGPALANLGWLVGRGISWLRERVGHKEPHLCEKECQDNWTGFLHPMAMPEWRDIRVADPRADSDTP